MARALADDQARRDGVQVLGDSYRRRRLLAARHDTHSFTRRAEWGFFHLTGNRSCWAAELR
jgi:hypothetical protein